MPYVMNPHKLWVKDPEHNTYLPQNVIAVQTAEEQVALVQAAGAPTIAAVQQAVADAQDAVAEIEDDRQTLIASIASVAGQGTDTTLTQSGVAADAAATGELKSAVELLNPMALLRNGSDNNTGNAYMVALTEILPYNDATSIKIQIKKPLKAVTNKYRIEFDTYNVDNGQTKDNATNRVTKNRLIVTDEIYIEKGHFDSTSIGFAFGINEVDENDNNVTLRTTDFADGDVVIVYDYTDASKFANAETQTKAEEIAPIKSGLFDYIGNKTENIIPFATFVNGGINGNTGEEYTARNRLRSQFIDVRDLPSVDFIVNSGYQFVIHKYKTNTVNSWQGSTLFQASGTWDRPSEIQFIKIVMLKSPDGDISLLEANNLQTKILDRSQKTVDSYDIPYMRNGTVGNNGNANGIATYNIIKIPDRFDYAMVEWTGYDISSQDKIAFGYCVFDGANDGMTSADAFIDATITKHNYNSDFSIFTDTPPVMYLSLDDLRADGQYFVVAVIRKRGDSYIPIRIADYQYSLKITYGYYKQDLTDTRIVSLNPEVPNQLLQAKRPMNATGNSYLSVSQPVVLLHFSDIHQDSVELKRIVEFARHYASSIDDVICTGDMVNQRFADGMAWWNAIDGADNILLAMGNHDVLADPTGYDWTNLATESEQYNQYFAPYISNWDCAYTSGKTYYYKDYANKNLRLIVLNCMLSGDDDANQLSWFTNTALAGAKTAGLSVLVANHYMPYNPQKIDCNFSSLDKGIGTDLLKQSYLTAINTFVEGGGKFVCHIAGHTHWDVIVKSVDYPNQMCVVIDALSVWQSNYYSDTQRTKGTKSQDLANLIVVDTTSSVIKIIRIGADEDHYLRSKKSITINYMTGDIISEN